MKRFLLTAGFVILFLCGGMSAFAQEGESAYKCGYDFNTRILTIEGAYPAYPHAKTALAILKPATEGESADYAALDICSTDEKGNFMFKVELPEVNGVYTVCVSLYWTEVEKQRIFIADADSVLNEILSAQSADEMDEAFRLCSIALDMEEGRNDMDELKMPKRVMEILYNEKEHSAFASIADIQTAFLRALACEMCAESQNADQAEQIIEKYAYVFDVTETNLYAVSFQEGKYSYGSMLFGKVFTQYADFYDNLVSAMLLSAIANSPGYSRINGYLKEAEPLLASLDLSEYLKLNNSRRYEVDRAINGKMFGTIKDLNSTIKQTIDSIHSNEQNNIGSDIGGGGSSGGSGGGKG